MHESSETPVGHCLDLDIVRDRLRQQIAKRSKTSATNSCHKQSFWKQSRAAQLHNIIRFDFLIHSLYFMTNFFQGPSFATSGGRSKCLDRTFTPQ
uniref:Uncharacterized protein n=1 Tax=Caenorhabditis japonica TaxID=281687 RepID=A0A8R1IIT3_CAEJA